MCKTRVIDEHGNNTHTFGLPSSFTVIVQTAALQFLAMMHNLLQVFRLQVVQRLKHVLFDVVVERVLDVSHLAQRFAHLDQTIGCGFKSKQVQKEINTMRWKFGFTILFLTENTVLAKLFAVH